MGGFRVHLRWDTATTHSGWIGNMRGLDRSFEPAPTVPVRRHRQPKPSMGSALWNFAPRHEDKRFGKIEAEKKSIPGYDSEDWLLLNQQRSHDRASVRTYLSGLSC